MAYILLIKGDDKLHEELKQRLSKYGHEIVAAENSERTRKIASDRAPELLICDQKKGSNQAEFLEHLSKDRKLSRVPVILLVDPSEMASAMVAYQCDIFAVLTKPVDYEHLVLQIETVLRQTTRQKQSRRRERSELRSQITRLEREMRATTTDLTDAAQNFITMQATPPSPKGIRIDVHYNPSGGFIGGDFYDFRWLDPRRLCVVMGDVSGHGIQAAVIQSMARKVISIGMKITNGDLRAGLRFANDELADDIPNGKFVAAMVGVLDVVSGEWSHARCGVPHPVFVEPDGARKDVVTAGVALGLRRSSDWAAAIEVHNAKLKPEGRIVMFTDGIIECQQDDGEEFDYKGIHRVLERAKLTDNVPELIFQAAHAGHRAVDDVLIISITRDGVPLATVEALSASTDDEDENDFSGFERG
jgi:sigma-B regulation protein RsbU (phosphoserine phosphatase)